MNMLKPNIWKVILTIVIFSLALLLPILPIKMQVECIRAPCPPMSQMASPMMLSNDRIIITSSTWIVMIALLAISYLISCFIINKLNK